MNRAQFCRRPHVRLALIADDFIGHAQFLEQPQHTLGTGIVEVMDGEHGDSPQRLWRSLAIGCCGDLVAADGGVGDWQGSGPARYCPGDVDVLIYPDIFWLTVNSGYYR